MYAYNELNFNMLLPLVKTIDLHGQQNLVSTSTKWKKVM